MADRLERIQIADELHFKEVVKSPNDPRLFIVDVYSAWCGPCNAVIPTVKALADSMDNFSDRCCYLTADAALVPELATPGATSIPKFLLYKNGAVLESITGANAPLLKQKIEELAPTSETSDLPDIS
ncbi:thioredoxin-1 [Cyclospora cayetanensis]|uniref:Thioredoxin-1 n=2 Tax=Cyclospora cayetanensis TaxID=88456 RepID=A0A6P5WFY9_9EIME|nr:thioredoxin-1 [Cyclospora cayetanensis]OEH79214.1 hypothetical protein cyc_01527 [Cyclospora cayetanensis]